MGQILASKSSSFGSTKKTNTAFGKIFGGATSSNQQSNILFKAFKSEAKGKVITKDVARRVIGKARELGMSNAALLSISGKVLKGEGAGSRLRYVGKSDGAPNVSQQKTEKQGVNMNKSVHELIEKKEEQTKQLNQREAPIHSNFSASNAEIRKFEAQNNSAKGNENSLRTNFVRKESEEHINEVQARLARIQGDN